MVKSLNNMFKDKNVSEVKRDCYKKRDFITKEIKILTSLNWRWLNLNN
jgi:hypothetical protein